jgi:hypothetical protein
LPLIKPPFAARKAARIFYGQPQEEKDPQSLEEACAKGVEAGEKSSREKTHGRSEEAGARCKEGEKGRNKEIYK